MFRSIYGLLRTFMLDRSSFLLILLSAGCLVATGCSLIGPDNQQLEDLRSQRRAWNRLAIRDYDVVLERSCFCEPESLRPVHIRVRADQTQSIVRVSTGDTVPANRWSLYPNIDALFVWLDGYLRQEDTVVQVTYDPALHFPVEVNGYVKDALDSGIRYTLSQFTQR
jgi:hypothetical protein